MVAASTVSARSILNVRLAGVSFQFTTMIWVRSFARLRLAYVRTPAAVVDAESSVEPKCVA